MNRVPNFRAWDKHNQKMYDTNDIIFIDFDHGIGVQKVYYEGSLAVERDIEEFSFNCVELMQSTGLKDKNGVEIFEGDIVIRSFGVPEPSGEDITFELLGVVRMLEGAWWIVDDDNIQAVKLWTEIDENEVIGNIYENGDKR